MAHRPLSAITVLEATDSHIASLTTILPRAFHPVNPYIARCLPDTPLLRGWWQTFFAASVADARAHPLIAVRASNPTNSNESELRADGTEVLGLLSLRHFTSDDRGAGLWTSLPPTADHDLTLYQPMIDAMTTYREKLFLDQGRDHWLLELFGVDHSVQGQGIGKALLAKACAIADESGESVFVQANASARGVYERVRFRVVGVEGMPGDPEYREYLMVRDGRGGEASRDGLQM